MTKVLAVPQSLLRPVINSLIPSVDSFSACPEVVSHADLGPHNASYPHYFHNIMMNLPKNLTIYWVISTFLAIWFLFLYSPPLLAKRKVIHDVPFAVHLIGAYTIYIACIVNTLFTPSTLFGKTKALHVWIGRLGLIFGYISFAAGAYCAWWPGRGDKLPDLGFAIGITVGGIAQVNAQTAGYRGIQKFKELKVQILELQRVDHKKTKTAEINELCKRKDDALRIHIFNMVGLFVAACGIPAGIRFAVVLGWGDSLLGLIVPVVLLNGMVNPFATSYLKSSHDSDNSVIKNHES